MPVSLWIFERRRLQCWWVFRRWLSVWCVLGGEVGLVLLSEVGLVRSQPTWYGTRDSGPSIGRVVIVEVAFGILVVAVMVVSWDHGAESLGEW